MPDYSNSNCSFPYAPGVLVFCSPDHTLVVAAYEHLPNYLQEPEGSWEGGRNPAVNYSHTGQPRGFPSDAASQTFVSLQYLTRSQSTLRLECSHLCKNTTTLPKNPALLNTGDLSSLLMSAKRGNHLRCLISVQFSKPQMTQNRRKKNPRNIRV